MADVLIAGGGIGGSALAIMLGRRGFTVELFERGHFPREKPCGEGLMPPGVALLERWGLAEAIGGAPFQGVRYYFGERTLTGRFPKLEGAPAVGSGQRRIVLDATLFRTAAATPGVTAHTDTPVEAPIVESGRVVGLVAGGLARRAPLVVAADGLHSRLRHQLGLHVPARRKRLGLRAHFRLAPGQSQPPWVEIFVRPGRELYVTPLPNREVQVAALASAQSMDGSADRVFRRWWTAEPALAERLEGAEPASELAGMSPLAGRARAGSAPGIVLLGDAAGFLDPITGGGMAQALLSAELLAGYLASWSRVAEPVAETAALFRRFERDRRAMLRNYRMMTHVMLWLSERPRLARTALSAVGRWPALFSHLVGVSAGMRPLFAGSFGKSFREPFLRAIEKNPSLPDAATPAATPAAEATPNARRAIS